MLGQKRECLPGGCGGRHSDDLLCLRNDAVDPVEQEREPRLARRGHRDRFHGLDGGRVVERHLSATSLSGRLMAAERRARTSCPTKRSAPTEPADDPHMLLTLVLVGIASLATPDTIGSTHCWCSTHSRCSPLCSMAPPRTVRVVVPGRPTGALTVTRHVYRPPSAHRRGPVPHSGNDAIAGDSESYQRWSCVNMPSA